VQGRLAIPLFGPSGQIKKGLFVEFADGADGPVPLPLNSVCPPLGLFQLDADCCVIALCFLQLSGQAFDLLRVGDVGGDGGVGHGVFRSRPVWGAVSGGGWELPCNVVHV
jgi:hypothetical protein